MSYSNSAESGIDYSQLIMREITPQRSVNESSFIQGSIQYDFSLGKPISALLNRSYFRIAVEVKAKKLGEALAAPKLSDRLAPAPYCADGLFTNISFQMQQQDISSVVSYAPQTAAVRRRLNKTHSFNKTLAGVMSNNDSFSVRQRRIASDHCLTPSNDDIETRRLSHIVDSLNPVECKITVDALSGVATVEGTNTFFNNDAVKAEPGDFIVINGRSYEIASSPDDDELTLKGVYAAANDDVGKTSDCYLVKAKVSKSRPDESKKTFYLLWQPALGVFNSDMARMPLPHGGYRMILSPNSDFKTCFLQSLNSGLTAGGAYSAPDPSLFEVSITEMQFYLATISKPVLEYSPKILSEFNCQSKRLESAGVLNFTVPVSTNAIAVWLQDANSGKDASFPPTLFKCRNDRDLQVRNLQISYANMTKSPVPFRSEYDDATKINKLHQRYVETMSEAGWLDDDGKMGAPEDFRSWLSSPLYFCSFIKGTNDPSVDLQVSIDVNGLTAADNCNLYIAAFYSRVVDVALEDGVVKAVSTKYE